MTVIHTLAPVYDSKSRILILGTMPSPKSRERDFYYMHSQNRFWPVIAKITGERLSYANDGTTVADNKTRENKTLDLKNKLAETTPNIQAAIQERKFLALQNDIAIWDVLASCDISGAEDSSIRNPVPNDFSNIINCSKINHIFCTGQTSYKLFIKLCAKNVLDKNNNQISVSCLPSTSPANRGRWPFEKLLEAYKVLADFLI